MAARTRKKNINLVIKQETDESISGQIFSWALTYGRYIIIITQIVVLSVFFLRFKLDRDHTDLKEAVTQKQVLVESVADLEGEIRRIQGKLETIASLTKNQQVLLNMLRFLEQASPSDMRFMALTLNGDRISFTAYTGNLHSFNFLLRQLQQADKFSDIVLQDILRRGDGRIEFRIDARVAPNAFT